MTKERLIWADSLKGWLMLLVILGHAIQSTLGSACDDSHLWNLIYSFHMPAFMAVSGWLAYRGTGTTPLDGHGFLDGCKRRGRQLLVPYMAWTSVAFLCQGNYTRAAMGEMLLYPDRSFWFLWVLFWICVAFNLARLAASCLKINEMVPILCTCLVLAAAMAGMEIRILGFQFVAYYFQFYTLGYVIHKFEGTACLRNVSHVPVLVILLLLWVLLAWGWTMHGLPLWVPPIPHIPSTLLQYAYRGLTAVLATVTLLGAAPLVLNGPSPLNRTVCTLGRVSLGLYVVHLTLMVHIVDVLQHALPALSTWPFIATAFVTALSASIFIVWLLGKNVHIARILLGKHV